MESLGIYISVPFCKAKCTFCNFASGAFGLERMNAYVDGLVAEIAAARARAVELRAELPGVVDTIYFGGGTPSLLEPVQLQRIFAALHGEFAIAAGSEVTVECAPGQMSEATLDEMIRQGVNRVSFGVQSFVDAEAAAVGRLHTAEQCRAEIARVRAAGISEISLDLIAGLPRQSAASWELSVDAVIDSGVPHASVYMLEVDEESRLGKELIAGGPRYQAMTVPSDEAMTEFYAWAIERFGEARLEQYEISNFARDGHASRHNLKYWQRAPYLGFGVDAHSMLRRGEGAVRLANADSLEAYAVGAEREVTEVDEDGAFEEALFLGLRRNVGVSLDDLKAEFGSGRVETFAGMAGELAKDGLLQQHGARVMLSERGRMISNEVFGELLRVAV
ncbi:oxygen-independent coproporphyrinogen-3 oxidase [Granulicella aggregans]|uniref:Heme chaperone HemW n=1 Tax=Granulicella aggregans TaxID=474949 RepID=A0A7W7Z8T0_9BACT|nr:radical SAM family heme chaperone HemW [Granulicella aggregans]MBB5055386.1 oxygen-independent coproporphyrinogen-3 oxidase [Granulicella aggregans]